ncbi:12555_t:CDS:2 [Racocetra persica]|uniref:12555_t:CDS:1 n=1 Tax=Racocetra persica TaxID=160502 RepID=A0ACA9M0V7_9GLOM|nr:12555_t:CDS:2 [Racocetra persica]
MSENTNILMLELKFAKRCARCDRQRKKCDIEITLGKFRCTNYPPLELDVSEEEDGKIYLQPNDQSNDNKYEINQDTFEKILRIKIKNGFDLGKFINESVTNRIDSFSAQTPIAEYNWPRFEEELGFSGFSSAFREFEELFPGE